MNFSIHRLVDKGDLLETKGWAVVQLSDSDGVCRSALPLYHPGGEAVVLGGKFPGWVVVLHLLWVGQVRLHAEKLGPSVVLPVRKHSKTQLGV